MQRKEMLKEIKAMIRANSEWLEMWKNGEISYGKMSQELSKQILNHIEDLGMMPPETWIPGLPEIEGNKCLLVWDEE
jgi:hypothetical protein